MRIIDWNIFIRPRSIRRVQLFMLLSIFAITLFFAVRLFGEGYTYFALKNRAKAHISEWEIVPIKGRYAIKATYTHKIQEKDCHGQFVFNPPYYLNEYSALSALERMAKEDLFAWFDPLNPGFSVLEKAFPLNLLLRTIVSLCVSIYFLYLYKFVFLV